MNRKDFFKKYIPQDDWMYQTSFDGETKEESFLSLKDFLIKEGLIDIPLPANARRLWWDYLRPDDNGNFGSFIWHPIIVSQSHYQPTGLMLSVYDENFENHFELWENIVRK